MGEEVIALLLDGEVNPPPARFTAMSYPIRPEAEVGEFITAGNCGDRPGSATLPDASAGGLDTTRYH